MHQLFSAVQFQHTLQVFCVLISFLNCLPWSKCAKNWILVYQAIKNLRNCAKKLLNSITYITPPFRSKQKIRKNSHPITCERLQQLLCSWMCSHHGYSTNSKCNNLFTAPTCVIASLINLEVNWFNCYILHGFINYFSSQMITDDYLSIFFSIQ